MTNFWIENKIWRGFLIFFLEDPHFCIFSNFFHNLTTKILWEMIGYVSLSFQLSKNMYISKSDFWQFLRPRSPLKGWIKIQWVFTLFKQKPKFMHINPFSPYFNFNHNIKNDWLYFSVFSSFQNMSILKDWIKTHWAMNVFIAKNDFFST